MIFNKDKAKNNFRFDYLKTYAWDRTVSGIKKFRTVFERAELSYLSVELSIFNKLFDEDDWQAEIKLMAKKMDGKASDICEMSENVTIPKDQNIFKYQYGWGNDEKGKFWEKGIYEWNAFLDGALISSVKFYVEDQGIVKPDYNPYFKALSLKTYEAPSGDLEAGERVYLKSFDVLSTRYVMGELRFCSNVPHDWHCELFFNIYDDTKLLVGKCHYFGLITPENGVGDTFTITTGWGDDDPGVWVEDNYTMEVVFMETVIAIIPFSMGENEIRRTNDSEAILNEEVNVAFNADSHPKKPKKNTSEIENDPEGGESDVEIFIDDRPMEEILADLNGLIGLENIKNKVREYIDYVSFLQYRAQLGIQEKDEIVLHSVFTGNPGTGKTTVVKLLGQIYRAMGLLSKGHVHTVEANDLISGYVRQTGKDTKKAIEQARGGILFIDEAYMLFKDGAGTDYGMEAIATIITEMSDGKGDIAIMAAGYPKEMEMFINSNPGLKSRFRNFFHFDDYTPDELMRIAEYAAAKKGVSISKDAAVRLNEIIVDAYRKRDRTFGNARFANALIDEAKINLGIRIMKNTDIEHLSKVQLSTLEFTDIVDTSIPATGKKLYLSIDENLLKEALDELDILTGLTGIKQEVAELVKLCRYYKENNRDILKAFSLHSVFTGNPGTGKTTVARIIAKIYKALGMLERGHLIDADGSSLIAGYVGQTAEKTKKIISESMGGILFIDEAYSITDGRNNDFGKKAIAALIKEMEDHRREFGVIVAGYTQNMKEFMESNPGLKSRFDQNFHFEDFTEEELWVVAENMYRQKGLKPDHEAEVYLKSYISLLYKNRDRFFGNARAIRKIVEKTSRKQELRMADLPKQERTETMISSLTLNDLKQIDPERENLSTPHTMGFKLGKMD